MPLLHLKVALWMSILIGQGIASRLFLWAQTIVYELNVKGFSQLNSRIPENIRGTYAALAHPENIAYFKSLGITSLELLPVNFFIDEPHLQEKRITQLLGL